MIRKLSFEIIFVFLCLGLGSGCQRHISHPVSTGYFKTPWQDESQFIMENIVSDLAEQMYFAKYHHLPDADIFYVTADETPDSTFEHPTYALQIDLDQKHSGLKTKLTVNGPIWSPEVYDDLALFLARNLDLPGHNSDQSNDAELLGKLTDGRATTIESENESLSGELAADFSNATLHEKAALLLGAFTLREHSGDFFEIRSPLCRITSHLALARYFGAGDYGINGRLANTVLLTLMGNEADAMAALKNFPTNDVALVSWSRALYARNTDDYRPMDQLQGLSGIECVEWFHARKRSSNGDIAWSKLSDDQKKTADFVRVANESGASVGLGHELLDISLPVEFDEEQAIYEMSQGRKMTANGLVDALNTLPERCFSPGKEPTVRVIGWGMWAGFLQRHLCQAMQENFNMLQWKWGVPDDAKTFSAEIKKRFNGLRFYPFVRRFNAVSVDDYHQSVDDGFKVTVDSPQLVPAECWNYLCYNLQSGESYRPNPNPHVNEWHKHNPPPGTAYNIYPRLDHPSLTDRPDSEALLDKLHQIAPYNWEIDHYIYRNKYHKNPTYAQASALFYEVLSYKPGAMATVAETVRDEPDRFEMFLSQAAEGNPAEYFGLGDYFLGRNDETKAILYYEKGTAEDPDSVAASYYASWMIKYYLKHGRVDDARKEADFAGEVYSSAGLQAKAEFFEATGDYDSAFEWYAKDEERYDQSGPLLNFCLRYKAKTGDSKFDGEIRQRMSKVFPGGQKTATLSDFSAPPVDGTVFEGQSQSLASAGMKRGDVVVAVNGIRVQNFNQYQFVRDSRPGASLDLIVWQGGGYHEVFANPPNHLFGVDMGDYRSGN